MTDNALAKAPAVREVLRQGSVDALAGFGEDEITTLCALLRRLNENLDRMVAE
ncbi:MAG: hypothetical protein AAAB20_11825 [Rhizobium sp.]|uniref:hypothetical protein n=1 Tax=Rhizobium sp. TaxID=391 RepID=UPI0012E09CDB